MQYSVKQNPNHLSKCLYMRTSAPSARRYATRRKGMKRASERGTDREGGPPSVSCFCRRVDTPFFMFRRLFFIIILFFFYIFLIIIVRMYNNNTILLCVRIYLGIGGVRYYCNWTKTTREPELHDENAYI